MRGRYIFICAWCFVAALTTAACRQPDGPLPTESVEDPNRLTDVARDLLNIASGDANAPREFADDVKVWGTKSNDSWDPGDVLAQDLAAALKGTMLTEKSAAELARHIWIAAAGRELSSRQVDRLQDEVRDLLVSIGSTESAAGDVADQIENMQDAVTTKRTWWFQLL